MEGVNQGDSGEGDQLQSGAETGHTPSGEDAKEADGSQDAQGATDEGQSKNGGFPSQPSLSNVLNNFDHPCLIFAWNFVCINV